MPRHSKIRLPHAPNTLPFELDCSPELLSLTRPQTKPEEPETDDALVKTPPGTPAGRRPPREEDPGAMGLAHSCFVFALFYLVICWMGEFDCFASPHLWILLTLVCLGIISLIVAGVQNLARQMREQRQRRKKLARASRNGPRKRRKKKR